MNYNRTELGNVVLHTINTNRFKTIRVEVCFRREAKKEEISLNSFLFSLLVYSTKNYDYKALIEKEEDLFNLKVSSVGEYEKDKYRNDILEIKFIHPKYSYKEIETDSLDFLKEIIFNPNLLNEEYFEVIKNIIKTENLAFRNNKREYAKRELLKAMEPNKVTSYPILAFLEELDNINVNKINDYYKDVINNNQIDIFVVGDIEESFYKDYFKELFKNNRRYEKSITPIYTKEVKEKEIFIEDKTLNQSKLEIGLRVLNFNKIKERSILNLYKVILGTGPNSKLFKEVREKNSLAYYSNASIVNSSLLLIESGIDGKNYNKTVGLIKDILNNMVNISEEDVTVAKKLIISSLKDIEYSANSIIDFYYRKELDANPRKNIKEIIDEVNNVNINEIIEFSKRVFIDTILLYGVKNGKDRS
jgi:predicted Zn-dependent peptidase